MPLSIDRLTATPTTIEMGGRTLRLAPLTLSDMGALQAWIHAQLPDPIALARRLAEGMPPEVQTELLRDAFRHALAARKTHLLGTPEADEMIATLPGFVQVLSLMCRANHPELTPDDLAPLVGGLGRDEINRITLHAFGIEPTADELAGAAAPPAGGTNGRTNGDGVGDPKAVTVPVPAAGAAAAPPTTNS
jgi:hypothetical protein